VLGLQIDPNTGEGVFVYSGGRIADSGFDRQTAVIMSLLNDAPAQDGDVLDDGASRRGFWADALDDNGAILGSRLWMLETAECSAATAERAKTYAAEALKWMVDAGHVRSIAYETTIGDEAIELRVIITEKIGSELSFGPFKVTGS
jgi:phage gp46-like protein